MNPFPHDASEEIKKCLFHNAMKSNWEEAKKTYEENPWAHTAKITSSGDTALHIAISNGEESVVTPAALQAKNELGNTPLHLAAYLGNARMCRCIAGVDTTLIGIRNDDNETPFFLAVRHGRKEAFHALHDICGPEEGYDYCRGKDGETILHSAISGEYFGIFVDELQLKTRHALGADLIHYNKDAMYPENYQTCVGIIYLFRNMRRVLLAHSNDLHDEENMRDQQH